MNANEAKELAARLRGSIEKVIVGKSREIDIVLAALLAGGHVLLEDVPGTGKTMLAKTLARSVDLKFARIQFTPDLLPSDIIGINLYNPKNADFSLKKGAVFTNILLADEINRATPRTQSALLESMEERQVTIDGVTHKLEPPYFVIATQNPIETQGTFPLPEAQLDRFMVKLSLGYPSAAESVSVLQRFGKSGVPEGVTPVCTSEQLTELSGQVRDVFINDEMLHYIVELTEKTRLHPHVHLGVSARGSIALMNICKAWALISGRSYVIPDDVQGMLPYVYSHRMIFKGGFKAGNNSVVNEILTSAKPPVENWDKRG